MCPLHNGLDEDDYGLLSFTLDGDGDDDGKKKTAGEDGAEAADGSAEQASDRPAAGPADSVTSPATLSAAEDRGGPEDAPPAPAPKADTPAAADEAAAAESYPPARSATEEAEGTEEAYDAPAPETAANAIGLSAVDRSFNFQARAIFTRHGFIHRVLSSLRIFLPVAAVASLFLHLTSLPHKYVWLLASGLLLLGLAAQLLLKLLRKPWQKNADQVELRFCPETVEIRLPLSLKDEFGFNSLPDAPAETEDSAYWEEAGRLALRLPLDNLLDQAYHTNDRTTIITFDVDYADRLLTLRIPDAALDRESRSELETEVFNRAGRSLRAIRD